MSHSPVPWIGLLALVAMFVIPFLPDWIFEGPRTVKHWPRRHVCGDCGAAWTSGHVCEAAEPEPVFPAGAYQVVEPEAVLPARARARRRAGSEAAHPAPVRRERLVAELRRLDR
jgi:hypothetical protein